MSCAVCSFFKSHVRLDAPPANGTVVQSPPDACTLTAEKVTSSAFASLNGLSLSMIVSEPLPPGALGPDGSDGAGAGGFDGAGDGSDGAAGGVDGEPWLDAAAATDGDVGVVDVDGDEPQARLTNS